MSNSSTNYVEGGKYWDRQNNFVMGDIRQRPNLLALLGNISGERVLESGCGTGFFSRKLAKLGPELYACDIEKDMLNVAIKNETESPLGILYKVDDIRKTSYENEYFDKVVSVGVLFHLDRDGWKDYLKDSFRILKKGGKLFISIEHPFLFTKFSPTRNNETCWAIHKPLEKKDYKDSCEFEEKYMRSDGEFYITKLWHHPIDFILNLIIESGFTLEKTSEVSIEKQDLISEYWGEEYGYPAFIQIVAKRN